MNEITPALLVALTGALAALDLVIALFFLRFFARSRDRLFALFATAFGFLGVQRLLLALASDWGEDTVWLYGLRLIAFVLIIVAIADKNRGAGSRK
jgi:uncharacterized membrane protein HdeD (DUF308 family)